MQYLKGENKPHVHKNANIIENNHIMYIADM